jgi:hypothetical protein
VQTIPTLTYAQKSYRHHSMKWPQSILQTLPSSLCLVTIFATEVHLNSPITSYTSERSPGDIDFMHVEYDMDSDDETWLSKRPQLSEKVFEETIDKLEKGAFLHVSRGSL